MFLMYGCVCDELIAMKEGLNDVIPPELLSGLTAEVHVHIHCIYVYTCTLTVCISTYCTCTCNVTSVLYL